MAKSKENKQAGSPEEMKDEDILRASQKEPAMFEILVERYQQPLFRAAYRIVRGREEAEDIVQEAFVKIYKNADKFQKMEGIEFKSWAYKITVNTAITHYRKLKRGEFLAEDPTLFEVKEGGDTLNEQFLAADAKTQVEKVLQDMPEHLGRPLKMYFLEDKSYKTISAEEKISIPTLKMRLFRAKRLFKKLSDQDENFFKAV